MWLLDTKRLVHYFLLGISLRSGRSWEVLGLRGEGFGWREWDFFISFLFWCSLFTREGPWGLGCLFSLFLECGAKEWWHLHIQLQNHEFWFHHVVLSHYLWCLRGRLGEGWESEGYCWCYWYDPIDVMPGPDDSGACTAWWAVMLWIWIALVFPASISVSGAGFYLDVMPWWDGRGLSV